MAQSGNRNFLYIAVCTGNLVALTAGIALTWTSPVIPKLNQASTIDENPFGEVVTPDEESWIGSLLALGAVFGPIGAGLCADIIGRKKTLIFCAGVPFALAFIILAFAKSIVLYYIARFMLGFGVGAVFTVLPIYNSEIAEDDIRGTVSSSMNVFVTLGLFFSYLIGPFLSILWFSIICAIIPTIFVVTFFLLVPESPHYLIAKNNYSAAENALMKIRSDTSIGVDRELKIIKSDVVESMANKGSFMDIFKSRGLIKALIISLSLVAFQQLSGINIVLFYAQDIFKATGSKIDSATSAIIVGAVQFLASFVTPIAVDRLGRRMLLFISAVGMLISEVPLGLYFYLKDDGKDVAGIFWLPILCLIVYIITYNVGFGPLPWTVMGEVFPASIKTASSTATASFCWMLGFIITKFFNSVSDSIGLAGSYWLFSGFCLAAAVFVFVYLIETKGKSFQEIQRILSGK